MMFKTLNKAIERPMVAVQPASNWLPTYRARLLHFVDNLGIEIDGFAEVVAKLEVLNQSAPETPVALMSIENEDSILIVFYDVTNAHEIGHYRLPKPAPVED
jgi:hypothetical protein